MIIKTHESQISLNTTWLQDNYQFIDVLSRSLIMILNFYSKNLEKLRKMKPPESLKNKEMKWTFRTHGIQEKKYHERFCKSVKIYSKHLYYKW